jgi:hypothetical protein
MAANAALVPCTFAWRIAAADNNTKGTDNDDGDGDQDDDDDDYDESNWWVRENHFRQEGNPTDNQHTYSATWNANLPRLQTSTW